jgi:outer membrane protein assembly factor BamA
MPRISRSLAVAALVLSGIVPLAAHGQLLKPQTIKFVGTQEYTPDELLVATGVKRGQTYTADFFNESAQKLLAIGVFEKVSFKFDGVDLVYSVGDNPELYPVVIDNLPLDPATDPNAELRKRIPLYHGKVPAEGSMLDSVKQALEAMLAEQGIKTTVAAIPAGVPKRKATSMKFHIDTPAVKIGDIHLTGVSDPLAGDMAKVANQLNFDYSPRAADGIENAIAVAYRDRGYAAVKVHATRSGAPIAAADAIRVPFDVQVVEGRVYRLGTVQLGSTVPFALEDVTRTMPAREHITPENRYSAAVRGAVETRLKARGYLDCSVTMTPAIDEAAGTVNYTIDAEPGPVYHLGLLKFENVSDAMRALLMRSWQMMPGDPFNEGYLSNFIFLAQKNDPVLQRSLVGVKAVYNVHADPDTRDVNVIVRLERQ